MHKNLEEKEVCCFSLEQQFFTPVAQKNHLGNLKPPPRPVGTQAI